MQFCSQSTHVDTTKMDNLTIIGSSGYLATNHICMLCGTLYHINYSTVTDTTSILPPVEQPMDPHMCLTCKYALIAVVRRQQQIENL